MKSLQSFAFFLIFLVLAFNICESKDCSNPFKTIVVSQSNTSNFTTIQSAIDSVPTGNSQWIHIQISPGVYRYIIFSFSTINICNIFIIHWLIFKNQAKLFFLGTKVKLYFNSRFIKTILLCKTRGLTLKQHDTINNFFIK
jgi:hypothetical protein